MDPKTGETRYLNCTVMTGIVEDASDMAKLIVNSLHKDFDYLMFQFEINTS